LFGTWHLLEVLQYSAEQGPHKMCVLTGQRSSCCRFHETCQFCMCVVFMS